MSEANIHPQRFQNRVALVTGGSRGIGRACCLRLAKEGARVAVSYRSGQKDAEETLRQIQTIGGTGMVVQGDVSDSEQVDQMIGKVEAQLGEVELLVNNSGIFHYESHTELTEDSWRQMLDVNLTGTFLVTWRVKEGMLKRQFGRIVNLSSLSGLQPRPMAIAYAVSKAGMISFTQSTATAWAGDNIRVNAVAPGLIETEILSNIDKSDLEKIIEATPIPRMGTPEEVAAMVSFLLSDESDFTTGQTLVLSGGRGMLP
ncbi:SDR family NAD(P)-dependent oxidoreductase [Gimesia aquarii]|uniref:3-oxoacyl-[acyl-carrier-protein] reductase FabG n=1 Tax=Gimesia aquarii TaxID=2527964 RepID=A0A517WRU9_9PLAN|nr:3-oxoacyl-ACP reductase family protein [Gimesia aquarii]QDU07980.1 3-oxoacyl-[acyl-carrier-protein] reductase FabG [Gimesia aquarii]